MGREEHRRHRAPSALIRRDPLNYSDPFGLCPVEKDGKPCTAVYAPGVKISNPILREALNVIAASADRELTVYSGDRSPSGNAAAGGATRSYHLTGEAADVIFKGTTKKQTLGILLNDPAIAAVREVYGVRLLYHQKGSTLPEHSHLDLGPGSDITEQQKGRKPKYVPLREGSDPSQFP